VEALSTFQPDDSLSLEYQPIFELRTGNVAGFECTVRLKVEELGMVSAGELVPLAEANDMMLPVGRFVLKEACCQIRNLRKLKGQELYVSVNISAVQLQQQDFADTVYLALKDAGLPGSALQLEISERIMDVFMAQADKLHVLRRMGVRIALDDYGAGTGQLTHLYNMPLDVLKVDKSFLTGATASQGKEFILKTLVDLAHNLNLQVAAVGVEHFKRLNTLMKLGYDMAQGYHFCPPLNPTALEVFLDTRSVEGNR
jgi:EAL domain-containing protein (putative c-di-GMP-specific phosphodiesterase class I)